MSIPVTKIPMYSVEHITTFSRPGNKKPHKKSRSRKRSRNNSSKHNSNNRSSK